MATQQDPELLDSSDGEGGGQVGANGEVPVRNRPRRKATEKPSGPDALRQSFSKRKKGIAAKAYQLHRLTDAKVALFVVNDKGSSWAYATPGFGAAVSPTYLALMRKLAGLPSTPKLATEVIGHTSNGQVPDDRDHWQSQIHPALIPYGHATVAPQVYKLPHNPMAGTNMVTMLHHGFPTTGQAVGHPTGHPLSIITSHADDAVAAAAAAQAAAGGASHLYATPTFGQGHAVAAVPVSLGLATLAQPAQTVAVTGMKRGAPGSIVAGDPKQAKTSGSAAAMHRPQQLSITRQGAILPVEAPPPEGIFGKLNSQAQPMQYVITQVQQQKQ